MASAIISAVALATAMSLCTPASASTLTWNISGTVLFENNSGHAVGESVTGSFAYDPSTPVGSTASQSVGYFGAISSFTLAPFTMTSGATNIIAIADNFDNGTTLNDVFSAQLSDSTQNFSLNLSKQGSNPAAINSLALPLVPYNPSDFDLAIISCSLADTNTGTFIDLGVTVDAITLATTPLPASLPMFMAGMGVISLLLWRRKQSGFA